MKFKLVIEKPKGKLAGLPKVKKAKALPDFVDVEAPKVGKISVKAPVNKTVVKTKSGERVVIRQIRPAPEVVLRNVAQKDISLEQLHRLILEDANLRLVKKNISIVSMGHYSWLQYLHDPEDVRSNVEHLRLGWDVRNYSIYFEMRGHTIKNGKQYEVYAIMPKKKPSGNYQPVKIQASVFDANCAPSAQGTYICAKLFHKSVVELTEWVRALFSQCVQLYAPSEYHATIAYSKEPIYGFQPRTYRFGQAKAWIEKVSVFGEDMAVLRLNSSYLSDRAQDAAYCGATSDFETYKPHITIGKITNRAMFEAIIEKCGLSDNSNLTPHPADGDWPETHLVKAKKLDLNFAYEKVASLDPNWGSNVQYEQPEIANLNHGVATIYDKPRYGFLPIAIRNSQLDAVNGNSYVVICPILEIRGERLVNKTLCYDASVYDAENVNVPLLRSLRTRGGLFSITKHGHIYLETSLIMSGLSENLHDIRRMAGEVRDGLASCINSETENPNVLYGEL